MDFEYCPAWPDGLKELSRRQYRAACRIRNLEASLDRISPNDFDRVMDQLEAARTEQIIISEKFMQAKFKYDGFDPAELIAQEKTDGAAV